MEIEHEFQATDGPGTWLAAVFDAAYDDCIELRTTNRTDAYARIIGSITENERVEFRCKIDGRTVAVAAIVLDHDMHVGECLSMQWCYVLPEYRGTGRALRAYFQLVKSARKLGLPYAYTKRMDDFKYEIRYGNCHG